MPGVYLVPSGPKNLASMFPEINWNQVSDYWLEILAGGSVIGTTPLMVMGCCCSEDDIVVHFMNYAGEFDQMPFQKPTILHDSKSGDYKKALNYPLEKQDYGWSRFNVNSNDTYECTNTCLEESDSFFVQQLFDAPFAFIQWEGIEGQPDDYLPIKILDGTFQKQKNDFRDSSNPVTVVKFKLSNDFIIQRT